MTPDANASTMRAQPIDRSGSGTAWAGPLRLLLCGAGAAVVCLAVVAIACPYLF